MKILKLILLLTIFNAFSPALANNMQSAFNQREKYKDATIPGNPDEAKEFLNPNADVSHLQNLDDASLGSLGRDALQNSEFGKILQNGEEKKTDAIERYKINPQNPWLKDSLEIEKNPLSKTGGKGLSSTEVTNTIAIKKSCVEGADFNVDVGLELILEAVEEEYLGPPMLKTIDIPYSETPSHWWQEQRYTSPTYHGRRGHGVDFGYHIISNAPDIISDIQAEINKRITEPAIVTVPNQDIIFIRTVHTEVANRNVTFSGPPQKVFLFLMYTGDALVKFHYNSQEKLKKLVEKAEYWQVATEGMEELVDSNECYETGRRCLKSGVKRFFGKYDISRPCWYEQISYRCSSEPKDGCAHLIKQDCRLVDSVCEYKIGAICLRWKREFICGGKKKEQHYSLADSPIYCLGGDCHTPTLEENQDFANVAYLAALNEANKDCVKESNGICKNPITVFAGNAEGCNKAIAGFINCCSSMKGWGKDINLSRCSPLEKGLALKRDKGLCHRVGTYCAKKDPILKTCLVKKTSFCCFGSKLARIFQEQGREQLGISWGSASLPNCRPFTIQELVSLDFSKFNMEELFDALLSKGKANMHKSFPALTGEIPAIQKEHMATTREEKREIRRRAEAEAQRKRLAKLEEERLKKERLIQQEKERLAQEEARRQAQRLAQQRKEAQKQRAEQQRQQQRRAELKRLQSIPFNRLNMGQQLQLWIMLGEPGRSRNNSNASAAFQAWRESQ